MGILTRLSFLGSLVVWYADSDDEEDTVEEVEEDVESHEMWSKRCANFFQKKTFMTQRFDLQLSDKL